VYDAVLIHDHSITMAIQVNGKVRDRITVPSAIGDDDVREVALGSNRIRSYLNGQVPKQVIIVSGRLVNIVT
jgi:leucyl-tRNA synthetase